MRVATTILCLSTVAAAAAQTLDQQLPQTELVRPMPHGGYEKVPDPPFSEERYFGKLVSKLPHLVLEIGPSINPCGSTTLSLQGNAAMDVELERFIIKGGAAFNTARKSNDGTINNYKGHDVAT